MSRWSVLAGIWLTAGLLDSGVSWAQAPSASGPAGTEAPGISVAELDRMTAPLAHDSIEDRRAAAAALAALGPECTSAISQKLAELRKAGDGGVYTVLKAMRERSGRESSFDLLEALVQLKPDGPTQRAVAVTAMLRSLSHAGTTPAARQLVLLASDAGGVLRPELSRQLKSMGDRAVAALIEAKRDPSGETRTWAGNLLESMGKRTPGDTVQTKDNQALADVLRAYASIKDLDALPVVLSFVNSERAQVRAAAREATLAYGQDAIWKLREAYAALTGDPAPEGLSSADLAKKTFEAYDRFRLQEVYALLDKGLAAQRAGQTEEAVKVLDEALARQPMLDRRAEMVPAYVAWAESREATDRASALAYLRKALRLDESGPDSAHIRSEILALEGEDLLARGIPDTEPFEQALALDPQNARARSALDRLRTEAESSRARSWRLVGAAAVLVGALAGIAVLGRRRTAPAL
jgi:tetratricopeptide (TPR) repeat protein